MEEQPPIWRVVANILNTQSQKADKGWSSSLGSRRKPTRGGPPAWGLVKGHEIWYMEYKEPV